MARRRRTLSSRFYSFVSFSLVISCVQERTSCVYSKFPQSRRRRFTVSTFSVSLRVFDGDPLKTRYLPPTSSLGSSSKRSVPKSCVISLALVAEEPGSSQIWRARSSTATMSMLFVGRDHHRSASPLSWLSVAHVSTPQHLQPSAASTAWSLSRRNPLHSPATGLTLGFQGLGLFWVLKRLGRFLVMGLLGLIDQKPVFDSSQPNIPSTQNRCRFCLWSPFAVFFNFASHQIALQEVISATPFNWWFGHMFHLRVKTQKHMKTVYFPLVHWRIYAVHLHHLGATELSRYQISSCRGQERSFLSSSLKERTFELPRYQISFCRGQERSFLSSSFLKERTLSPPSLPKRGTLPSIFMSKMSSKSLVKLTNFMSVEENSLKIVSITGLRVLGCTYNSPDDLSSFMKFVSLSLSYACCNAAMLDWSFMAFCFVIGLIIE